jgi:hypothetical protein
MLSLLQSDQFQQEYKQYQEKISKISDIKTKQHAEGLIKKLIAEIKAIDNQHRDMFANKQSNTRLTESRSTIADIRKQLDRVLRY